MINTKKDKKINNIINIFLQLDEIYDVIGNTYRSYSYKRLINEINKLDNINDVNKLNISKNMKNKINEILETGNLKEVEKLKKEKDVIARVKLQKVKGIGPIISKKLVNSGINSIDKLKNAVKNNKIKLTNMQKIGLNYYKTLNKPINKLEAIKILNKINECINKINIPSHKPTGQLSGSYLNPNKKYINDIDIIIVYDKHQSKFIDNIQNQFINDGLIKKDTIMMRSKKSIMAIIDGHHVDIKFVEKSKLPFFTLYFNSGVIFSRYIRSFAKKNGYLLSQNGLFDAKTKEPIMTTSTNEQQIFKKIGHDYVPINKRF